MHTEPEESTMLTRTARRAFAPRNLAATALVVLAFAGIAWAAVGSADITDNSILSIDLKNGAVQSADIKNGTITSIDVRDESLNGDKIENRTIRGRDLANDTVLGTQVDESSLGTVPTATSAATATNATQLGGVAASEYLTRSSDQQFVSAKLAVGDTKLLASNGAVSLFARCRQTGPNDVVEVIASTTVAGAFLYGTDSLAGSPDFLNPDTVSSDREVLQQSFFSGTSFLQPQAGSGFVIAPDGRYLGIDGESTALGLSVLGSTCVVAGTVSKGTIA
jgi:hypothetical protein